jgi:hypothetical protein
LIWKFIDFAELARDGLDKRIVGDGRMTGLKIVVQGSYW